MTQRVDRLQLLNDPGVAMRAAQKGWQAGIWSALPGIITRVDLGRQTCEVQPTVQGLITRPDGSTYWLNMPVLLDVPIVFPRAGGFALTFPITAGDEVLVVFASRAIDAWWNDGRVGPQVELRMHSLSDGFAIPGPTSVPRALAGVSATDVQLRNGDGTALVSIRANGDVAVTSPGKVTVDAQEADVTAPVIKLNGNVTITGDLTIGGITTGAGEATFAGTKVSHHQHGGVTNGPSKTGPPENYP